MHQRFRPVPHRFTYRVFSMLLDLDELPAIDRGSRLFGVDRAALLSFRTRDHGPRDGSPLRPWLAGILAEAGIEFGKGRVRLHCFPRLLGYVFNPLSTYFCEDEAGRLTAIVYEVKNTFGGQHAYVLPVPEGAGDTIRQRCDKTFPVSPFIPMEASYRFAIRRPEERFNLRIDEHDSDGRLLVAAHDATRLPLDDRTLLRVLAGNCALTFKVIVGIHFEALRLWFKGTPSFPAESHGRPPPSATQPVE